MWKEYFLNFSYSESPHYIIKRKKLTGKTFNKNQDKFKNVKIF